MSIEMVFILLIFVVCGIGMLLQMRVNQVNTARINKAFETLELLTYRRINELHNDLDELDKITKKQSNDLMRSVKKELRNEKKIKN